MDLLSNLDPRLGIIVIVVYILGMFLKQIKAIPDEYIPFILTAISIVLVGLFLNEWSANAIIQGVLIAASTVYGNQIFKQSVKKIEKDMELDVKE